MEKSNRPMDFFKLNKTRNKFMFSLKVTLIFRINVDSVSNTILLTDLTPKGVHV